MTTRPLRTLTTTMLAMATLACERGAKTSTYAADPSVSFCREVPRAANRALTPVDAGSDWFSVYQVEPGVFAIIEPRQFQEAISYLVVGTRRALLFDSGIGLVPIRPVIERLTRLPVTVLNSHSHFDHVGGNAEFDDVIALDTEYTRENERGKAHAMLKGEVDPESLCPPLPAGVDTSALRTRAWRVSRRVKDGDVEELGQRTLEILQVPGHTPDAIALHDREHHLLFTGDSYYDATIWLFVPETDLDAYERSMARLVALAPSLNRLLPAHNTASVDPGRLGVVAQAVRTMRAGGGSRAAQGEGRVLVTVGDVTIMTTPALLAGQAGRAGAGGTGLAPTP